MLMLVVYPLPEPETRYAHGVGWAVYFVWAFGDASLR